MNSVSFDGWKWSCFLKSLFAPMKMFSCQAPIFCGYGNVFMPSPNLLRGINLSSCQQPQWIVCNKTEMLFQKTEKYICSFWTVGDHFFLSKYRACQSLNAIFFFSIICLYRFPRVYLYDNLLWPPVQMINFSIVPSQYRSTNVQKPFLRRKIKW